MIEWCNRKNISFRVTVFVFIPTLSLATCVHGPVTYPPHPRFLGRPCLCMGWRDQGGEYTSACMCILEPLSLFLPWACCWMSQPFSKQGLSLLAVLVCYNLIPQIGWFIKKKGTLSSQAGGREVQSWGALHILIKGLPADGSSMIRQNKLATLDTSSYQTINTIESKAPPQSTMGIGLWGFCFSMSFFVRGTQIPGHRWRLCSSLIHGVLYSHS